MGCFNFKPTRVALLLGGSALSSPCLAQQADVQPPVRYAVDQNGVDLSTGNLTAPTPSISIGSGGRGFSYQRSVLSGGVQGWSNPYRYALYGAAGSAVQAVVGLRSINFNYNSTGGTYDNQQGSGETLTYSAGTWTLTLRDGTVIKLDNSDFDPNSTKLHYESPNVAGVAHSVTFPNQEKLTLVYKQVSLGLDETNSWVRLQSVQSSSGYMVKLEYSDNSTSHDAAWSRLAKVTLLNSTVDYCNPSADSCTFSQTWPSLTFSYVIGAAPEVDTVTDTLGRATVFTFGYGDNSSGKLKAIQRPTSSTANVTAVYDSTGKVSSVTVDGRSWTYSWSLASPLMTATITNPDTSHSTYKTNTSYQQITSATDELSRTTTYAYDTFGRLTDLTYPEGNKDHWTYDARGNVAQKQSISKTPGTPADIFISNAYPSTCTNALTCNQPISATDARGNETDYTYDSTHGGVLTVTRPAPTTGAARPQVRYGYTSLQGYYKNSSGSIVASSVGTYLLTSTSQCQTLASCAGAADEVKTTIGYGPQVAGTPNNLLPISIADGADDGSLTATTAVTYDTVGNATYVDGPLSGTADTTRTIYDAGRQVLGQIGPDPDGAGSLPNRANRLTYNGDGQVTRTEQGTTAGQTDAAWAAFSQAAFVDTAYDASGRKTTDTVKSGATSYSLTQYSYDSMGRLDCAAVRMNTAVYGSLPTSACTQTTATSFGPDQIERNVYDSASEPTQHKIGLGTTGAATERTLTYNNNGTVKTLLDANNNLTTYTYDGFDRLLQTQYPNPTKGSGTSNTSDYEQLYYDAGSNVTSYRPRSGTLINFGYDNLNRLTAMTSAGLDARSYTYDLLDRQLTATFQSGGTGITNTYDALNRLTSSQSNVGGTAHALTYAYDLAGRRTQMTWWDGFYVKYDRLVTGEITKVRENGATSGVGVLATYGYDNLGNKQSTTFGNNVVQNFTYDPVSRLSSLSNNVAGTGNSLTIDNVTYSPASQLTSLRRTGDAYAWTGHGSGTSTYTTNGLNQQITLTGSAITWDNQGNLTTEPQTSKTYSYDIANRPTSAVSGGSTRHFYYDPLDRLDVFEFGVGPRRFIYDGQETVAELDSSAIIQHRYVFGDGPDEVLVDYTGSGTTSRSFLSRDERGSVISLTDSSGAMVGINTYDEYGKPGAANQGRFQYTGQAWLPEAGVYNYKARDYLPELGIFAQSDPAGYKDSPNLYAYAADDPVNLDDPSGLDPDVAQTGFTVWGQVPDVGLPGYADFVMNPTVFIFPGEDRIPSDQQMRREQFRDAIIINGTRNTHEYIMPFLNPCSASDVFGYFTQKGHSAPGAPATREGFTRRIILWGGNPIAQYVNSTTRTIINITLPEHRYYPGTVTIQVDPLSNATSTTTITGRGSGAHTEENVIVGQSFFGGEAAAASTVCLH